MPITSLILLLLAALTLVTSTVIEVSPSNEDRTIFQGGHFRRTCRHTLARDVHGLQVLHNGLVIQVSDDTSIMLDVAEAELSDAGTYECRLVFTNGSASSNTSMGSLMVVDLSLIVAPPNQYVVAGEDIRLQCEFNDPDHVYGVAILTIRRGSQAVQQITNASVEDEGEYECDVNLFTHSDSTLVPVTLHVFTPIAITEHPVNYQELTGVQPANFSIAFTGRQSQNILIMWYRNGVALYHTNQHQLIATFSDESMTGTATIQFPEMSRVNGGVYRVVVSTDFGANVIPENLRRQEVSFQVEMRVPPPDPVGFRTELVAEHHAQLRWDLPINHPDEDVQIFQLEVNYSNGSTASSVTLDSSARSANVSVFPGMSYQAHLIAKNGDGSGETKLPFSTPPAAPYVTSFESRRVNETHFNVSISLRYTGGGDTITFSVYFRETNNIEWSRDPVMVVELDAASALEYQGTISGEIIRGKGPLEFELRVENGKGFMNRTGSVLEKSDLPGATTPTIAQKSDTSATIEIKLPLEGTPPFITIVLNFTEPKVMEKNYTGLYTPGQTFEAKVNDLSPKTAYSLKARAVNYAGNGPDSQTINFTTNEAPPTTDPPPDIMDSMPWLLPVVAVSGVMVFVVIIVIVVCSIYCYCHKGKGTKKYSMTQTTCSNKDLESAKELEPDHEMLQRNDKSPPPSSARSSMHTLDKKPRTNTYIEVPPHDRREGPPRTASNSPSNQKWQLEKSNNRESSSTLNSGSAIRQSQDSLKKHDILSTGSESHFGSPQSSQQGFHSHRTSKDSLGNYKRKMVNPSISSVGSESTETTYQHTPFLSPQVEETYSFQSSSMPFIPEGCYYSEDSSLAYSVEPQSQYVSDV